MKILFVLMVMAFGLGARAQGFFNQQGAWIKNQIRQVALWGVYIKDVEKGYAVAKDGLGLISDIKKGDFSLHLDHFNSLSAINPVVRDYGRVGEIFALGLRIGKLVVKSDDAYVNSVFTHLVAGCREDLEQLLLVLTPGRLQLTDDERIGQIDKMFANMQDRYAFAREFNIQVKVMNLQQRREAANLGMIESLNGIKP